MTFTRKFWTAFFVIIASMIAITTAVLGLDAHSAQGLIATILVGGALTWIMLKR